MPASANILAGAVATSLALAPQETLGCPRHSIRHASARAAPGSCEAARCAAEAHKCPTTLYTWSAILPQTLQVLLAIQRPRIAQTVSSRFRDHNVTVASRPHLCQRIHSQHARRRDVQEAPRPAPRVHAVLPREGTVVARVCHPACLHICHNAMLVRIVTKGVGDVARTRALPGAGDGHWWS